MSLHPFKTTQHNKSILNSHRKGYSDNLTLRFLTWLQTNENCKFIGFFDSDVYGLNIYWQYNQKLPEMVYSGIYLLESQPHTWLSITLRDIAMMTKSVKWQQQIQ